MIDCGRCLNSGLNDSNASNLSMPTGTSTSTQKRRSNSSSGSTTSTRISTTEMQNIVERLRLQKHRSSTRQNYYTVWKIFSSFCLRLDNKPESWEDRIVLFIGYLIQNKKQSATVKSYLSAIRAVLQDDGIKLDENTFLVSSLTRACKYVNDTIQTRLPIQKELLRVILRHTENHFNKSNQPYLKSLYKALFSAMYYGLLRISEVTAGGHPVLARDVYLGSNKKKMLFILRSSKTHWICNKPQLVKITSTSYNRKNKESDLPCPYQLLKDYSRRRGPYQNDADPFFVFSDGSPIKPEQVRHCLKNILLEAGFDYRLYGTHSFRIGRSCDLLALGLSVETIKKLGRWKSNSVFRYLRYYVK